ncbi:MAG TPA: hypothetical protein VNG31_07845 [Candidatus Baltobacteraceae bacterium]|nr:hypothetical protein [Candidatus Baltobacteraceae bacterium]
MQYERIGASGGSACTLAGLRENEMRDVNIFADLMINIRSNVVRLRGLGVKGDDEGLRAARLGRHNLVWGPAGRNLLKDVLAVESQWRAIAADAVRYSVLAREEDLNPRTTRTCARTTPSGAGERGDRPSRSRCGHERFTYHRRSLIVARRAGRTRPGCTDRRSA